MRKLTKRVQAGGFWFDVPASAQWLCVDSDGELKVSYYEQDKPFGSDSDYWIGASSICVHVDLEGADWRECCWYVGDQTEGESVERREWMARGAEMAGIHLRNWFNHEVESHSEEFAEKIRSGEVK